MKICCFSPLVSYMVGGGETYSVSQALELAKRGHEVHIACLGVDGTNEILNDIYSNYPTVSVDFLSSAISSFRFETLDMSDHKNIYKMYFSLGRAYSDYCSKNNFDCVVSHYTLSALFTPKSIKNILFLHGLPPNLDDINSIAIHCPDVLCAVSESVREGWRVLCGDNLPIQLMHNGVDEKKFFPDPSVTKDVDIFFVGRLIEIKGVQYLLKSLELLVKRGFNLKTVIAGTGPYAESLKKYVHESDLLKNISFVGRISDADLLKYYQRSRLAVFPSYAKEGVLTTMLEASSCGTSVITCNCCGMVDFMKDGVNGYLANPQDEYDLATKIENMFISPEKAQEMAIRARKDILDNWTWKKITDRFEALLLSLS